MAAPAIARDYDLVILDGRVMDPETLYDGVANVGITDGRIVADGTVQGVAGPTIVGVEVELETPTLQQRRRQAGLE